MTLAEVKKRVAKNRPELFMNAVRVEIVEDILDMQEQSGRDYYSAEDLFIESTDSLLSIANVLANDR